VHVKAFNVSLDSLPVGLTVRSITKLELLSSHFNHEASNIMTARRPSTAFEVSHIASYGSFSLL
jgi:hypothetical protein